MHTLGSILYITLRAIMITKTKKKIMPDLPNQIPIVREWVCVCDTLVDTYLNPPAGILEREKNTLINTDSDEYTKFRCERDIFRGHQKYM